MLAGRPVRRGPDAIAEAARRGAGVSMCWRRRPPPLDDIAAEFARLPILPPPHEGDIRDGFLVGRTIYRGRYTLLKRARDTLENRDVVLKLPLARHGAGSGVPGRLPARGLDRRADCAAAGRSDYLDLPAERRGSLYLVMPYYRGETLEERLKTSPPALLAEGVGIAISLCEAVEDLAQTADRPSRHQAGKCLSARNGRDQIARSRPCRAPGPGRFRGRRARRHDALHGAGTVSRARRPGSAAKSFRLA